MEQKSGDSFAADKGEAVSGFYFKLYGKHSFGWN